jgi:hypothetical protein
MPTSGNVLALLPVLTPYTPTSAQFDLLYPYALDEFKGDDPGCSKTGAERALAYLMAHYLAGGEDQIGFSGEKIDDYSTPSPALLQPRPAGTSCTGSNSTGAATHSPSARQRSQASSTRTSPGFLTCTSIRTPSCA